MTEFGEQLTAMGAGAEPLNYLTIASIAKSLATIAELAPCPHHWVKTSAKNGWVKCAHCLQKARGVLE